MAKIEKFSKENLAQFRKEFLARVEREALEAYGIELKFAGITFTEATFKFGGTAKLVSESAKETMVSRENAKFAFAFGSNYQVNTKVRIGKEVYVLKQYDARKHKFPVIVTCLSNGKDYKLTKQMILSGTVI